MPKIEICGVAFDDLSPGEAAREALENTGEPCVVFTADVSALRSCRRDGRLASLFSPASLVLPAGSGVLLTALRSGLRFRRHGTGVSFANRLLCRASEHPMRVFLLGGGEGEFFRAGEELSRRYPGVTVCGTSWGFFRRGGEEERSVLSHILACRPDLLLVGLGFPFGEEWITEHLELLSGVAVIAEIGARGVPSLEKARKKPSFPP